MVTALFTFMPQPAYAADCTPSDKNVCCGDAKTSIISCTQGSGGTSAKDTGVWGILLVALNILTAGVGILAVGGIVYGSVLYASAGDKAEQTKQAITTITNVVIGLVAYGLMYLVLNFLIPGGIFA